MSFFEDFVTNPIGTTVGAASGLVDSIAPGSGKDAGIALGLAAAYYLPGMAGDYAASFFTAAGPSTAAITAASVAKAATTVLTLSALGDSMGQAQQGQVSAAMAQGLLINTSSNVAALPVIYGTRRVGGTRVLTQVSGSNNEYLHLVIALCEGEIDTMTGIYLDGVRVDDARYAATALVAVVAVMGTDSQAAESTIITDLPTVWTSAHKGSGVAYVYLRCKYDRTAFTGFPTVTVDVKGRKVYDPRTSTTGYSENPALCIRDYLTNTRYGRGIDSSLVDDASIIAAANYCDALVTIPGGTQKRYTCNGVVNVDGTAFDNIQQLLASCRAMLVFSGGKYKLVCDAPSSSVFSFNEDNITGSWSISTAGRRTKLNRVTAQYYSPAKEWQPDYAISESTAYRAAEDNGLVLEANASLPFTTNLYAAQRLAGLQLKQSRFGLVVSFKAFQSALRCEVGDVVDITHSTTGWVGKLFRITQLTILDTEEVEVVCTEYDATVYDLDTLTAITSTPTLSLPNPFNITAPTALTLTSGTADLLINGDGSIVSRIKCAWAPPANIFTATAEIQYKLSTDSVWQSAPPADASQGVAYIAPVKDALIYNVRIRFVNTMGVQTDWYQPSAHTVVGKTAAPSNVAGMAYSTNEAGVLLSWTKATDKDYLDTTLRVGASWAAGTNIYTGSGNTFLWTRPTGTAFNIWAKHRDTSLNESTTETLLAVTYASVAIANSGITLSTAGALSGAGGGAIALGSIPGTLTSGQIAAGIISANAFAAGIEPVTVVSSVPGTLSTHSIVSTADGKLYRWNGSAYVSAVPSTDITGTLSDSQLAAIAAAKVTGTLSDSQLAAISAAKVTGTLADSQLAAISAAKITGTVTDAQIAGMAASKVTGTLSDSQLAAIAAAKITGQIVGTQITDNSITTAKISAGAVTASQIAADTITASQIAAGAITSSELAAGSVVAGKIAAGTIQAADIAAGAITAGTIAAGAITATELAAGAVTAGKIAAGAIVAGDIAANTITASQIAANTITASQIAGDTITAAQIAAGAITASELAANAVTAGKISAGTIVAADIAANTITAGQIAAGAITATQLAANTITAGQIAAGTITATQLAANTITASQKPANTITSGQIAASTITASQIAASTITTDRILVGAVTALSQANSLGASTISSGGSNNIVVSTTNVFSFTPTVARPVILCSVETYIRGSNAAIYNYYCIIQLQISTDSGASWSADWQTVNTLRGATMNTTQVNLQFTVPAAYMAIYTPGTNYLVRGWVSITTRGSTGGTPNFNSGDYVSFAVTGLVLENKV